MCYLILRLLVSIFPCVLISSFDGSSEKTVMLTVLIMKEKTFNSSNVSTLGLHCRYISRTKDINYIFRVFITPETKVQK